MIFPRTVFIVVAVVSLVSGFISSAILSHLHSGLGLCAGIAGIVAIACLGMSFQLFTSTVQAEESPISERRLRYSPEVVHSVNANFGRMPTVHFVARTNIGATNSTSEDSIQNLFEEISEFSLPRGRRLILAQLSVKSRLAEPLEMVLREDRAVSDSVLKGIASKTDLIPCARISSTVKKDAFWKFVARQYEEIFIIAPETERELWLQLFDSSSMNAALATARVTAVRGSESEMDMK